jgi:aryl-alcohol dehydrogenase-like predicted oxidoreductase
MLERQIEESTSILDGYLRLYQIHSATLESGVLENGPVLDALARLKERPLTIGLTTSGPGQAETLRRAMEIRRGGEPLFGAVQCTWNLLERSAETALREAKQAGMTVIVKEVLANGRLTARGGNTSDAKAIAAALAQPWADLVLLGPTTIGQLQSNLKSLEVRLSADELRQLDGMREDPARYWAARARLPWN